jgi:hypothetical protein
MTWLVVAAALLSEVKTVAVASVVALRKTITPVWLDPDPINPPFAYAYLPVINDADLNPIATESLALATASVPIAIA